MTRKSIKTRAQETVVAAGKSAVEGTKTLAGEFAHAAAAAAAVAARLRLRLRREWSSIR